MKAAEIIAAIVDQKMKKTYPMKLQNGSKMTLGQQKELLLTGRFNLGEDKKLIYVSMPYDLEVLLKRLRFYLLLLRSRAVGIKNY